MKKENISPFWKWVINIAISIIILIIAGLSLNLQCNTAKLLNKEIEERVKPRTRFNYFQSIAETADSKKTKVIVKSGEFKISNIGNYSCEIKNARITYLPYKKIKKGSLKENESCQAVYKLPNKKLRKDSSVLLDYEMHEIKCDFNNYGRMIIIIEYDVVDLNENSEHNAKYFFIREKNRSKKWSSPSTFNSELIQ